MRATIEFLSTSESSREARDRVREALDEYRGRLVEKAFAGRGVQIELATYFRAAVVDVATEAEVRGASLAHLLPLIACMILLTAGSFAAIDLVAGEKERGTLETLYIQPVSARSIVRAKFAVVLTVSLVAAALNGLGLLVAVWWAGSGGVEPGGFAAPPARALGLIAVVLVPLAVLTSSLLIVVSSWARSYREGQTYLLPLTLVALVLVGVALLPGARLASVLAVVPITNAALAMREALTGQLTPLAFAGALAASAGWAWLGLRRASTLLEREDIVLGLAAPTGSAEAAAAARERRALMFGAFAILAVYYVGSWMQSRDLVVGLALTLWGVVLLPAVAYPVACRAPLRVALGLRSAPPRAFVAALVIAAGAVVLNLAWMSFQNEILPPPDVEESLVLPGLREQPAWLLFLLLALSPGICEELLWRGAFQGDLQGARRPLRTILIVGFFFGAFHLSVYRFLPTAAMGCALAFVRLRSGSILPGILLHTAYNAAVLWLSFGFAEADGQVVVDAFSHPVSWLAAATLVAAGLRAVPRR